jgi:hypothetical protein
MFYSNDNAPQYAIVLVSDAFLTDKALQYVFNGLSETIDFRYLITDAQVTNFGPLHRLNPGEKPGNKQINKSFKYTLLSRGSLLACENKTDLDGLVDAMQLPSWNRIGFNHFFQYD